jgi:hypothetical protein
VKTSGWILIGKVSLLIKTSYFLLFGASFLPAKSLVVLGVTATSYDYLGPFSVCKRRFYYILIKANNDRVILLAM